MFENKELVGMLLESDVVRLILNLREINEKHITNSSNIEYLGKTYDAQLVSQTLKTLEAIAKVNSLEVRGLTAESSLDELLGINEAKEIEITVSLKCWSLLEMVIQI
jgi:hypothetical protein